MVREERAADIFDGPLPSPYMLFTHDVRSAWRERIPAVVHVDGTARIQTVSAARDPLVAAMLEAFERRTGIPVVVNTSLNTAGRPMVDDPRDALECFGSAPVDALAIGPFLARRAPVRPWLPPAARGAAPTPPRGPPRGGGGPGARAVDAARQRPRAPVSYGLDLSSRPRIQEARTVMARSTKVTLMLAQAAQAA